MARRYLCIVVLFAAAGCGVGGDGEDNPRSVARTSDIEVKQGALTIGCAHSPCHEGAPLNPACGFYGCVARICEDDSWCCTVEWDDRCVAEMAWCHHRCDCNQVFTSGEPFYPDASPCVSAVYSLGGDGTGDHYCSEVWWDGICVAETGWPAITASCHPACQ